MKRKVLGFFFNFSQREHRAAHFCVGPSRLGMYRYAIDEKFGGSGWGRRGGRRRCGNGRTTLASFSFPVAFLFFFIVSVGCAVAVFVVPWGMEMALRDLTTEQ